MSNRNRRKSKKENGNKVNYSEIVNLITAIINLVGLLINIIMMNKN